MHETPQDIISSEEPANLDLPNEDTDEKTHLAQHDTEDEINSLTEKDNTSTIDNQAHAQILQEDNHSLEEPKNDIVDEAIEENIVEAHQPSSGTDLDIMDETSLPLRHDNIGDFNQKESVMNENADHDFASGESEEITPTEAADIVSEMAAKEVRAEEDTNYTDLDDIEEDQNQHDEINNKGQEWDSSQHIHQDLATPSEIELIDENPEADYSLQTENDHEHLADELEASNDVENEENMDTEITDREEVEEGQSMFNSELEGAEVRNDQELEEGYIEEEEEEEIISQQENLEEPVVDMIEGKEEEAASANQLLNIIKNADNDSNDELLLEVNSYLSRVCASSR